MALRTETLAHQRQWLLYGWPAVQQGQVISAPHMCSAFWSAAEWRPEFEYVSALASENCRQSKSLTFRGLWFGLKLLCIPEQTGAKNTPAVPTQQVFLEMKTVTCYPDKYSLALWSMPIHKIPINYRNLDRVKMHKMCCHPDDACFMDVPSYFSKTHSAHVCSKSAGTRLAWSARQQRPQTVE